MASLKGWKKFPLAWLLVTAIRLLPRPGRPVSKSWILWSRPPRPMPNRTTRSPRRSPLVLALTTARSPLTGRFPLASAIAKSTRPKTSICTPSRWPLAIPSGLMLTPRCLTPGSIPCCGFLMRAATRSRAVTTTLPPMSYLPRAAAIPMWNSRRPKRATTMSASAALATASLTSSWMMMAILPMRPTIPMWRAAAPVAALATTP